MGLGGENGRKVENLEGLKGDIVSGPLPILHGDTGVSWSGGIFQGGYIAKRVKD